MDDKAPKDPVVFSEVLGRMWDFYDPMAASAILNQISDFIMTSCIESELVNIETWYSAFPVVYS